MTTDFQEGIFFQSGARPGKFFAICFLEALPDADGRSTQRCIDALWSRIADLKNGVVPGIPGLAVPHGDLTALIAFGPNCFKLSGTRAVPDGLRPQFRFLSPHTSGGGALLRGSGLRYREDIVKNVATEDVAIQFIADTQLATYRAIVETQRFLATYTDELSGYPVLAMASSFHGFQRDDHRSWIGFHDGISNMRSGEQREAALKIPTGEYEQGSYLTFIRIEVDLDRWETLSRREQELAVGRDKVTGCAFDRIAPDGTPQPVSGCPVLGTTQISQREPPGNIDFFEPPLVGDETLLRSHIQRANLQHNQNAADPQSLRIYRQGYEFLETSANGSRFSVGLNFVAFQSTPSRVIRMLTRSGWLGEVNFGGVPNDEGSKIPDLLKVTAAGTYLAPPVRDSEAFPGESIFVP